MKKKSFLTVALSLFLAATLSVSAVGCGEDNPSGSLNPSGSSSSPDPSSSPVVEPEKKIDPDYVLSLGLGHEDTKDYTLNEYTSQMPGQWCTIISSDAVDADMEGYTTSNFYEFNYEFYEDGTIVPGSFRVDYSASTSLKDVTAKYAGRYGLAEDATSGQAFAMTLRQDLTWDDGTPIKAEDFVWTMQQQLSPNYLFDTAANYYSGNYIIHNAQNYLKQGQVGWFDNGEFGLEFSDLKKGDDGVYMLGGCECYIALKSNLSWLGDNSLSTYVNAYGSAYFGVDDFNSLLDLADESGNVTVTDESLALIKGVITAVAAWGETEEDVVNYMFVNAAYPELNFSEVGFFVGDNEYELVIVIDNTLNPIKEDGSLSYEAGYYFSGWPLVKKDIWEACEDSSNGVPYSTTYATTLTTSASWGPYKVTNYQTDKTYTVSRNDEWFGYALPQYKGQYQTDSVYVSYIPEWDTAWQAFQLGRLDSIGMNVKIVSDYRDSKRAYFTPSTATYDLNIQSNATSHTTERNNLLLNYEEFRKAISLSLDRDDYCAKNNPSSQGALGYLNSMYYYDVENGKVYRESDQAKEAILVAYGATKTANGGWQVGEHVIYDLDEAYDAVTGYNLTQARQLVDQAVTAAIAAGDYVEGENVVLTYGTSTITDDTDRVKNWFQAAFDKMTKGTKLEGKIKIEYFIYSSSTWSQQFKKGEYDLCFGGWSNAAFNPAYLLCETQISDSNRWAVNWDPSEVNVAITLKGDEDHAGGEFTYSLADWRLNLQGMSGCTLDVTQYPIDDQLTALAAVEAAILQEYYCIPVFSKTSASLMGYKVDYFSYDYNTFMGYGGIRYMTFNYDDTEWAAFVAENNGELNYRG